jgi:hypothetical protein
MRIEQAEVGNAHRGNTFLLKTWRLDCILKMQHPTKATPSKGGELQSDGSKSFRDIIAELPKRTPQNTLQSPRCLVQSL